MPRIRWIHVVVSCALASIAAPAALARPMPIAAELPLSNADIDNLRARLSVDEYLRTVDFLATLRVFEDDVSRAARPIFYIAPVLNADRAEEVIGGQEVATSLLELLDQVDLLLGTIGASHRNWDRVETGRTDYLSVADELIGAFGPTPPSQIQRLLDYATTDNPFAEELPQLPARVAAAMNALPSFLRRLTAAEILRLLDRLGVPLTAAERNLALSAPVQFVLDAVVKLRAQLSTLVFGIRHARFVQGMTADQVRMLGHYRTLRPDVTLLPLPLAALRIVPTTSVVDANGGLGGAVSGNLMVRGVNAATGGVCGLANSCTVIIEYSETGARSALLSTRGASIMPVQFVGEITGTPALPAICDVAATRQQLALPFGLGVLADRELLRVISEATVCAGPSGPAPKYSASLALSGYRHLLFEPGQLPRPPRQQIAVQLDGQARGNERVRTRMGIVGSLLRFLSPTSFLDLVARVQVALLMPRFPDELVAGLLVAADVAPDTVRFDFDGLAIACWKRADAAPYLSACPDANAPPAELELITADALEDQHCGGVALGSCFGRIQAAPPDANGFLR